MFQCSSKLAVKGGKCLRKRAVWNLHRHLINGPELSRRTRMHQKEYREITQATTQISKPMAIKVRWAIKTEMKLPLKVEARWLVTPIVKLKSLKRTFRNWGKNIRLTQKVLSSNTLKIQYAPMEDSTRPVWINSWPSDTKMTLLNRSQI